MAGRRKQTPGYKPKKPITPQQLARLIRIKENTYSVYVDFKFGYRNKEDVSTLPPNVLVVGSQNVLTNAADRVASRQGYVLDGAAADPANIYKVDSSYDFLSQSGSIRNLRKWNGNLEVRYKNPNTNTVSWINIMSFLNPNKVCNFTDFFDANTELKKFCLFVNGANSVFEWTGAMGSVSSYSTAAGIISAIGNIPNSGNTSSGGIGYAVGDVLTVAGGDGLATLTVNAVTQGGVATYSIAAAGNGYNVNDTITLSGAGGTYKAQFKVATLTGGAGSGVASLTLLGVGVGYFAQSAVTTTTSGGGANCTINVLTTGNTISAWTLTTNGSTYAAANNVSLTGGAGTGATLLITSVGTGSITLQGTKTCSQLGFYDNSNNSGKFQLLINGVTYIYTTSNANGGQTFVGISPTPGAMVAGDAVIQVPQSYVTGATNSLPTNYNVDLISTLNNQVWYGCLTDNRVYVSKTNDYTNIASSSVRLAGEGALLVIDAAPIAFSPQGTQMYISAGKDQWWVSNFSRQNLSVGGASVATELLYVTRLKTTYNQAAQSQAVVGHFKNSIMYLSNEPIFNTLGLVKNVYADPQITNISDAIKYDMDAYDFTDASVFYFRYFIYIAIPKQGIVRIFNVQKKYWEAPQTLPISRFYVVDGELYGHSYLVPESYKMFTGYNDNGNPINCIAAFAYDNMSGGKHQSLRPVKKNYNIFYAEGYLTSNTKVTLSFNYDFGGFTSMQQSIIAGTDARILFNAVGDGSLGKQPLGEYPIGSIFNAPSNVPKFRKFTTMLRQNYFEYQPVFSSNDIDQQWEILAFGPAQTLATELPVEVTE